MLLYIQFIFQEQQTFFYNVCVWSLCRPRHYVNIVFLFITLSNTTSVYNTIIHRPELCKLCRESDVSQHDRSIFMQQYYHWWNGGRGWVVLGGIYLKIYQHINLYTALCILDDFGYPVTDLCFYCFKNFNLSGSPIFRFWSYLIKSIPDTRHAH